MSKYDPLSSVSSVVLTEVPLSNLCTQITITIINSPAYVRFGSVPLPSHILHTFLILIFALRFASPRSYLFRFVSVPLGLFMAIYAHPRFIVYMSYATLSHTYGLLSLLSFSYISSVHSSMYSPFRILTKAMHMLLSL